MDDYVQPNLAKDTYSSGVDSFSKACRLGIWVSNGAFLEMQNTFTWTVICLLTIRPPACSQPPEGGLSEPVDSGDKNNRTTGGNLASKKGPTGRAFGGPPVSLTGAFGSTKAATPVVSDGFSTHFRGPLCRKESSTSIPLLGVCTKPCGKAVRGEGNTMWQAF